MNFSVLSRLCTIFVCALSRPVFLSSLEFVQIIFRHGQRYPIIMPSRTEEVFAPWTETSGRLTDKGKMQGYLLGQLMFGRYGALLNHTYNESEIYVQSGDDNRTVNTALTFLAGMFPVSDPENNWNPNISWQPIPIHSDPKIELIEFTKVPFNCPPLYGRVVQSKGYEKLWRELQPNIELLEPMFGIQINDLWDYYFVTQFVTAIVDLGAYEYLPEELQDPEMARNFIQSFYWEPLFRACPDLLKFTAGPLLDEILSRTTNYISGASAHKFVAYSAHGTNTVSVLRALNIPVQNDWAEGPYCNYLILELHKHNSSYFVELYYRENATGLPVRVKMDTCTDPCPLETFTQLCESYRMTYDDFEYECSTDKDELKNVANPIFITLTIIFGAALIILSFEYYKLRQRHSQGQDEARRPLLEKFPKISDS